VCGVVAGTDVWFRNMEGYLDSGRRERFRYCSVSKQTGHSHLGSEC